MKGYSEKTSRGGSQPARLKNEDKRGNCKYEEKAHFGQKIRSEFAPDRSSHMVDKHQAAMGRKMGGGVKDTSRSTNPSMYNDKPAKGYND